MKKHLPLTSAVLIMSILLMVQGRSYSALKENGQFNPRTVLGELSIFQTANQQLRDQIAQENQRIEELSSKLGKQTIEADIIALRKLSGTEAVSGSGIEITFDSLVPAFWFTDLIAQLSQAGAEAVAINGQRLIDRNAGLRDVSGGLLMRSTFLRAPYTFNVIGPQNELRNAVAQPGGLIDRVKADHKNLNVILGVREKIVIPALDE